MKPLAHCLLTFTVVKTNTWNHVIGKLAEGNVMQIFNTRQLVVAHACNPESIRDSQPGVLLQV